MAGTGKSNGDGAPLLDYAPPEHGISRSDVRDFLVGTAGVAILFVGLVCATWLVCVVACAVWIIYHAR